MIDDDFLLKCMLFGALCLFFIGFTCHVWQENASFQESCERKDGVVVGGYRSPRHCVRKDAVLEP